MIGDVIKELGSAALFLTTILRTAFTTRGNMQRILAQIYEVTVRSLPTVAFAGAFVGAVLVLQFNLILAKYDAQIFLGALNTSGALRQVGPLIISFLLAGKVGAYTAAELGTMRVTEQIDAIECLGTNPVQYLIVPRFIGIVAASLILLAIGLIVSIIGSMTVAALFCGNNLLEYANSIPRFLGPAAFIGGAIQSFVYGVIVGAVACHKGYTASGGARGVGRAVTQAAIYTNLYIVVANYLIAELMNAAIEILHKTGAAG